jgi:Tfp pilus assembly protein PilF
MGHTEDGLHRLQMGDPASALVCFERAIREDRKNPAHHYHAATAARLSGDAPGAERHYANAVRLKPDFVKALADWGAHLMNEGKHDLARARIAKAIELDPNNAATWANSGHLFKLAGESAMAVKCYDRALAINPRMAFIRGDRMACKLRVCDWSTYKEDVERIRADILAGIPSCSPLVAATLPLSPAEQQSCATLHLKTVWPEFMNG